jgi:hypothetical protein
MDERRRKRKEGENREGGTRGRRRKGMRGKPTVLCMGMALPPSSCITVSFLAKPSPSISKT